MNQVNAYWYEGQLFTTIDEANKLCVSLSRELLKCNNLSDEYLVVELLRLSSGINYIRKVKAYEFDGRLYQTRKELILAEFDNLKPEDVLCLL